MAYVTVPKDLTKIKSKVMLTLPKDNYSVSARRWLSGYRYSF